MRMGVSAFIGIACIVGLWVMAGICAGTGYSMAAAWEAGGHLRGRVAASWPTDDGRGLDKAVFYDHAAELRLNGRVDLGDRFYGQCHYEVFYVDGDSLENKGLRHRLDRLNLTWTPEWGQATIGRQALTWGNGMIFNPMDLFNPFAPTDFNRDYKAGDDMVVAGYNFNGSDRLQALYAPRRDAADGHSDWDSAWHSDDDSDWHPDWDWAWHSDWDTSSLAAKLHLARGALEWDLMAARHYESTVAGAGATGYMGGAAWRADLVWTAPDAGEGGDFLSAVANLDYSWVWWDKNFYGLAEIHYNGLGRSDYGAALIDKRVAERLRRGELHALGRLYLAGQIQMEAHPLLNLHLVLILNAADPSAVIQPRIVWDPLQDLRVIAGGSVYAGGPGTEYGGFRMPGAGLENDPPPRAFLWMTWFF